MINKQFYILIFALASSCISVAQEQGYKKRVLETVEVDFLSSYYAQNGNNAAVTGGIGSEELTDATATVIIAIPLNNDDVLTIDAGISAYTSASSSNLNPFDVRRASGASQGGNYDDDDDDDDDDRDENNGGASNPIGSPWVASSGASRQDVWTSVNIDYSHSCDDRNFIWNANASFAAEYDYISTGFGGGITQLFNEKNTTVSLSGKIYLDSWLPEYPTELKSFEDVNGYLTAGFFTGVTILDENGNASSAWQPISGFQLIENKSRNTFSLSASFSQIISKNAQFSIFIDGVKQQGWLANPMQRVYFSDISNYFIGNAASIPNYTSPTNTDVFQLADDMERLPENRLKIPVGARLNYYVNEYVVLRSYYRYYFDDWGLQSNTASVEAAIKITDKFTLYPSYRFYTQNEADYFAGFDQHLSTDTYYTSDFDLSAYNANQFSLGISYTDIFATPHIWKFGIKSIDLKYAHYDRNTGLVADIITGGIKFVLD